MGKQHPVAPYVSVDKVQALLGAVRKLYGGDAASAAVERANEMLRQEQAPNADTPAGWAVSAFPEEAMPPCMGISWAQHHDAYEYDETGASYEEIDALHDLLHPNVPYGLNRDGNGGGCDRFWCLHWIPGFAEALKSRRMRVVASGEQDRDSARAVVANYLEANAARLIGGSDGSPMPEACGAVAEEIVAILSTADLLDDVCEHGNPRSGCLVRPHADAAPSDAKPVEARKRRPHHLCPGPNCDERDVSKWVDDGVYHPAGASGDLSVDGLEQTYHARMDAQAERETMHEYNRRRAADAILKRCPNIVDTYHTALVMADAVLEALDAKYK